ncbi:MAG: DUF624 domain-containing protein [Oscillospiraceae bacterium]
MGLFHVNYDRPGPGVRKDEPEKNAFIRFFSILSRKFTKFIELNLLFLLLLLAAFFVTYLLSSLSPNWVVNLLLVLLVSPFIAGITFVTRNYAREEHAFLLSDFFEATKNNWKAFLINGAVCYFLYVVIDVAIKFYYSKLSSNGIWYFALGICIAIAFLLVFAQYYVPVMIVTFDLTLMQIYKNALIFAVLGLWRNLLLTVMLLLLALALYLSQAIMFTFLVGIIFSITLLFSLSFFLINFTIYPLIYKMMILPLKKNENEQEEQHNFSDK